MAIAKKSTLTRAEQSMPKFVREALEKHKLIAAYSKRPPYQRNDYLGWIAQAKLSQRRGEAPRPNAVRIEGRRQVHEHGVVR